MNGNITPSIQAIDRSSVHRICSGQVVLDLATAVKELVENSLDAGSSIVEVRLKEYGKELIEVSDNGSGISEENFEGLALKHHTSKLREFHDLTIVDTFGFRGEALSSLSALSDITITTQKVDDITGYKLIFDHDGKLTSQQRIAREKGTTVFVNDLFYTLPVRYKEFHRNFKKDFARMCHVLYAYSLLNSNVRVTVCNTVGKKKNIIISTKGNDTTPLNIITNLFGASQSKNCIEITHSHFDGAVLEEYNIKPSVVAQFDKLFTISGYISSVVHGCGRSSPDRQFFFINKRPCDYQKLSRLVNEVYHTYNHSQYPFVFLQVETNKDGVDVNVTPDKRQVLVQQEKVLFAMVKSSLKSIFDSTSTYYDENGSQRLSHDSKATSLGSKDQVVPVPYDSKPENSDNLKYDLTNSSLLKFKSKYAREQNGVISQQKEQLKLDKFFNVCVSKKRAALLDTDSDDEDSFHASPHVSKKRRSSDLHSNSFANAQSNNINYNRNADNLSFDSADNVHESTNIIDNTRNESFDNFENVFDRSIENDENINSDKIDISANLLSTSNVIEKIDDGQFNITAQDHMKNVHGHGGCRKRILIQFSFSKFEETYSRSINKESKAATATKQKDGRVSSFRARISPVESGEAEEELRKHVSKDMFAEMKVLGQFNLGFIIAKLKDDLFIIDQHASDEKYNFEKLQKKHVLKPQRLIQPISLEITPTQQHVLIDNLPVFEKNGFDFDIYEPKNDVENRIVKLISVPTHRNWSFGVADVEELIFMLSDCPNIHCRPSRVRQMFASRACRTSIMVGTPLNESAMKTLLTHMGQLDHPWNCPHGRPTMRHLINLQRVHFAVS